MSDVWLWLLLLACLSCAAQGLKGTVRHYEPLLPMASIFIGFVWIQLHGLWRREWLLPDGALAKTIFMALLCVLAFWWGYSRTVKPIKLFNAPYDLRRLLQVSFCLTMFGASFFFLISRLPEEILASSQPTGRIVALRFFAQNLTYGFALASLLWARYRDKRALWIAIIGSFFYIDRIILAGRRAEASELYFIITLSLLFGRGKKIPKLAMIIVMFAMVLAMHSTASYRHLAHEARWNAPFQIDTIDYLENLKNVFLFGGEELKNAVYLIEAYDRSGKFDFGLSHWNQLVFNYIPAQLVGSNIKSTLLYDTPDVGRIVFGYVSKTGATLSGLADSFGSFWYLGALKFTIIGVILKKIWNSAKLGSFGAQLLYMLLITKSLHVVTHNTHWFFSPWVHMAIFLFPCLLWARIRRRLSHANMRLKFYRMVVS